MWIAKLSAIYAGISFLGSITLQPGREKYIQSCTNSKGQSFADDFQHICVLFLLHMHPFGHSTIWVGTQVHANDKINGIFCSDKNGHLGHSYAP